MIASLELRQLSQLGILIDSCSILQKKNIWFKKFQHPYSSKTIKGLGSASQPLCHNAIDIKLFTNYQLPNIQQNILS